MRVLIVDDEPLARDRLRALISDTPDVEIVGEAENGADAISLSRSTTPDVLFLDIQMPRVSGFEVIERLGPDVPPVIIFTTAHSQHAAAAFDVSATDYLVKPFDRSRVGRALERARHILGSATGQKRDSPATAGGLQPERFAVRLRGQIIFVRTADILWIGAEGNYVRLYTGEGSYLLRESMKNLEDALDPNVFIRVHRSAFVDVGAIERISGSTIILRNGGRVPLGPSYRWRLRTFITSTS
jgi:two-component system, LytTR family, response regulator